MNDKRSEHLLLPHQDAETERDDNRNTKDRLKGQWGFREREIHYIHTIKAGNHGRHGYHDRD